jgi:hypothetical protein
VHGQREAGVELQHVVGNAGGDLPHRAEPAAAFLDDVWSRVDREPDAQAFDELTPAEQAALGSVPLPDEEDTEMSRILMIPLVALVLGACTREPGPESIPR